VKGVDDQMKTYLLRKGPEKGTKFSDIIGLKRGL